MTTTLSNEAPLFTEPTTLGDLGVDAGVLHDLTLKTLVYRGRMTRADLSDALKLSGKLSELMVMGSKQRLRANVFVDVFDHRPRQREAVVCGRSTSDLIEGHRFPE